MNHILQNSALKKEILDEIIEDEEIIKYIFNNSKFLRTLMTSIPSIPPLERIEEEDQQEMYENFPEYRPHPFVENPYYILFVIGFDDKGYARNYFTNNLKNILEIRFIKNRQNQNIAFIEFITTKDAQKGFEYLKNQGKLRVEYSTRKIVNN
jgi:hypothetical protein